MHIYLNKIDDTIYARHFKPVICNLRLFTSASYRLQFASKITDSTAVLVKADAVVVQRRMFGSRHSGVRTTFISLKGKLRRQIAQKSTSKKT